MTTSCDAYYAITNRHHTSDTPTVAPTTLMATTSDTSMATTSDTPTVAPTTLMATTSDTSMATTSDPTMTTSHTVTSIVSNSTASIIFTRPTSGMFNFI